MRWQVMKGKVILWTRRVVSGLLFGLLTGFAGCVDVSVDWSNPHLPNTINDIDGNIYWILKIGDQEWLSSDLRTSRYRNGDQIPTTDPESLDISTQPEPTYHWLPHGMMESQLYAGDYYTWYAAFDSRGVCPAGWRIPNEIDWNELIEYSGGWQKAADALKDRNCCWTTLEYSEYDTYAHFDALPGGWRLKEGTQEGQGEVAYWWISGIRNSTQAGAISFSDGSPVVQQLYMNKKNGVCIRCIRSN